MRIWICCLALATLHAPAAPVESAITHVTLFADRARVRREASPELPGGISQVEILGLPGWVNPASLRARLEGGEVLDVQTRREFLSQTPDAEVREAERQVAELTDALAGLQDRKQALQTKKQQIVAVGNFVTGTLPAETLTRDIPVDYFEKMSEFVYRSTLEIDQNLRNLERDVRDLQPELDARRQTLNALVQGNRLEQVNVLLRLKTGSAGPAALTLEYEMPGATWEAVHDIRVTDGHQVRIVSLARVRQTSGEDWENVTLSFSTHRPGKTADLPRLEALLLGHHTPVNAPAFTPSSLGGWSSSNDYYLANAVFFNRARGGKAAGDHLDGNQQALLRQQRESEQVFTSLEERGTTALYQAEGTFTVRSDGNPVRIPTASVKESGELMILAAPEISANAARGIELTYTHAQPLLPGEAALFLDGAYIGNTRLSFAGPGETFLLFAGSEDRLKITRKLNHDQSELKRGWRSNTMKVQYEITVENTGDQPLPLRLADRVPVSDDRDIKVEHVRLEPDTPPDEAGLVTWEQIIPPRSTRTFVLRYVVDYPQGLKLRRREANPPAADPFGGDRSFDEAPDPAEQILHLEKLF